MLSLKEFSQESSFSLIRAIYGIIKLMISGIINLKKEAGMTSHDAVFKLRKILGEKKIGHGGTLDPDVVGVLPIAVGKATRILEFMTEAGKVYQGEVTLGYATTTEDASGQLVSKKSVDQNQLSLEAIDQVMTTFLGNITQTPPMYSAVKVNGKKLYEYARAGQTVERPSRQITIHSFKRISDLTFENETCRFQFEVACSKGTYVRTLAVDLGEKLGFPSHMSQLTRTSSSGLYLEEALTLAEIEEKVANADFSFLLPIEKGVSDLTSIKLNSSQLQAVAHGRFIQLEQEAAELAAFFDNRLVAILEKRADRYKPRKVFI